MVNYIIKHCRKNSFKNIHVEKPKITQEEQRIDLWVRDEGYAIIIENKVYNAIDQENQLSRYIDKTKVDSRKYKDGSNIFIIYLSQSGKEPAEQTWKDYKDEFKDRYVNLSFKDDILPWLKNIILPNVRNKEINLRCALGQYIDYLEGLFFIRKSELRNMVSNKVNSWLGLERYNKPEERISVINKNIKKINELYDAFNSVIDDNEKEIFSNWKDTIREEYKTLKLVDDNILQLEMNSPNTNGLLEVIIWRGKRDGITKFVCEVDTKDRTDLDKRDVKLLKKYLTTIDDPRYRYAAFYDVEPEESQYSVVFNMFCSVVDLLLNAKKE